MIVRRTLLLLPLALSSCALLETAKPDRIFALTPLAADGAAPAGHLKIAVSEPNALRVLDSARIANRAGDLEFQYYTGAVWEDRAPVLLQHLLIASLRNRLGAEVTSDEITSNGTPLQSELQDFQIEPGNVIHITLVMNYGGATKSFETRQTATSDKMTDLVEAFDQGTHQVLIDVVNWIANAG